MNSAPNGIAIRDRIHVRRASMENEVGGRKDVGVERSLRARTTIRAEFTIRSWHSEV